MKRVIVLMVVVALLLTTSVYALFVTFGGLISGTINSTAGNETMQEMLDTMDISEYIESSPVRTEPGVVCTQDDPPMCMYVEEPEYV